jgi:hypothetical protein
MTRIFFVFWKFVQKCLAMDLCAEGAHGEGRERGGAMMPRQSFSDDEIVRATTRCKTPLMDEEAALIDCEKVLDAVEDSLKRSDSMGKGMSEQGTGLPHSRGFGVADGSDAPVAPPGEGSGVCSMTSSLGDASAAAPANEEQQRSMMQQIMSSRLRLRRLLGVVDQRASAEDSVHGATSSRASWRAKQREHTVRLTRRVFTGREDTRVRDFVKMPRVVRKMDKYSFTSGVIGICLTEYVMLIHERLFRYYYCALMFPLLATRIYLYRQYRWHYFLFDFCYFVNMLGFLVSLTPIGTYPAAWHTFFVCATGPVMLASSHKSAHSRSLLPLNQVSFAPKSCQ